MGKKDGRPWGDLMAIGGDFGWRPVGRFSWPPSRDAAKRGLRDARLPLLGHKTGPGPAARRADHRATPPSRSPPVRSWRADRSTPPGPSSGCRPAAPRSAHARPSGLIPDHGARRTKTYTQIVNLVSPNSTPTSRPRSPNPAHSPNHGTNSTTPSTPTSPTPPSRPEKMTPP